MNQSSPLVPDVWCQTYKSTKSTFKWTIHNFSSIFLYRKCTLPSSEFNFNCGNDLRLSGHLELSENLTKFKNTNFTYKHFINVQIKLIPNSNIKWGAIGEIHVTNTKGTAKIKTIGYFNEKNVESSIISIIDINNPSDYWLQDDTFTLFFVLKMIENETKMESKTTESQLNKDLVKLFKNGKHADITLVAADYELHAHKCLLACRSDVFAAMFEHKLEESESNRVIITDINPDVLKEMLHYIYTDKAPNLNKMAADLYAASDKYDLKNLKNMCEVELSNNISIETAAEILILADLYNSKYLKDRAIAFINSNAINVAKTEGFQNMLKTHIHLLSELYLKLA